MTSFLDDFPLDFGKAAPQELRRILARSYSSTSAIVEIVTSVGLEESDLFLAKPAVEVWRDVLNLARRKDLLHALVDKVRADLPPIAPRIDELLAAEPTTGAPGPVAAPPEWRGFDATGADERQIVAGFPTLLGIAFLEQGLVQARSVCRLTTRIGGENFHGTGFRVGSDLLLTNHHVLHNSKRNDIVADKVEAWFNYQLDWNQNTLTPAIVACDARTIVGEKQVDWAVVRTTQPIPDAFPVLPLVAPAKVPQVDDRVYIIQHPDGEPKMIGMDHNLVRSVDNDVVQYWTDTETGSSGSPVFDDHWQLVALHHRTVTIARPDQTDEFRNQGRRIERVIERMRARGVV